MSDVYLPRFLKQKAVYWGPLDPDAMGQPTYDSPVEVKCRWEDVHEEFIDMAGDRKISSARVLVDLDLLPSGVLWLGLLEDAPESANPLDDVPLAYAIQKFEKIPNIPAKKFVRRAML